MLPSSGARCMPHRMRPLGYRTALVTGASSGIGAALAKKLGNSGVEVVLAARRTALIEELAEQIQRRGGRARTLPLDLAQPGDAVRAIRRIDEELDGLELVIANAGVSGLRWSGALSWEDCIDIIDVNVRGAIATLTAVLPRMVERRRGHLVGISSMAAYRGFPHNACYSGSKAFLSTFLESLRVDLAGSGVVVTDARPGFVRTAMAGDEREPKFFMIDAERAAEHVLRAIARRQGLVAFPWPTAALVRSLASLPAPLYDRAARTMRPPPRRARQRSRFRS